MANRLIVGCGYVGSRVAQRWLEAGDRVLAITRSVDRAQTLRAAGIEPILWSWLSHDPLPPLPLMDALHTILICVSHASVAELPPSQTHTIGLEHLKSQLIAQSPSAASPQWIYLSTTGVYGPSAPQTNTISDSQPSEAAWFDEDTPVNPTSTGAMAAAGGEQWIQNNLKTTKFTILRPAGIYGPDRLPRVEAIRDRTPLDADPMSYLNLVHVADLAAIVTTVADRTMHHALYCVSDGAPVLRRDYYNYISTRLNLPEPIFAASQSNPSSNSNSNKRGSGNKRVSNRRLCDELSYQYLYPSYREGIDELFANIS